MRLFRPDDGRTPTPRAVDCGSREETRTMEDIRHSRLRFAVAAVAVAAGTAGGAAGRGDAAPAQKAHHASHLRRAGHSAQAQLKHGLLRIEGTQESDAITLQLRADRPD